MTSGPEEETMLQSIGTIVLFFKDAERAREWYEGLGFSYVRGYEGMHWFRIGDTEIMIHPSDKVSGGNDPAIHVHVSDVDSVFRRALELGQKPYDHQQPGVDLKGPVTRPWGVREFELLDPEGHRWAFTQPT
jgi:uncharacterized glyoxalase superfamily protein PhnB